MIINLGVSWEKALSYTLPCFAKAKHFWQLISVCVCVCVCREGGLSSEWIEIHTKAPNHVADHNFPKVGITGSIPQCRINSLWVTSAYCKLSVTESRSIIPLFLPLVKT